MKDLIEGFTRQLHNAVQIARNATLQKAPGAFQHVLISGLGGSGIGGTIVSEWAGEYAPIPVNVSKGYFIPACVNEKTLYIASSYSGDTEETLACLEQAGERKAHVICITSGGRMSEIAREKGYDLIRVPGGMPPRSCLGYSLTQQVHIFENFGLLAPGSLKQIEDAIAFLDAEQGAIVASAREIAGKLAGKTPVIYTTSGNEGIAIRLRQQINENAKMLCWHHVIPEMNHNELVGWPSGTNDIAVLLLRDPDEYERNNMRIAINKQVFEKYTNTILDVFSKGRNTIEKGLYMIHLGDWISWFLSEKNGVDANEVRVIDHLKSELGKQ